MVFCAFLQCDIPNSTVSQTIFSPRSTRRTRSSDKAGGDSARPSSAVLWWLDQTSIEMGFARCHSRVGWRFCRPAGDWIGGGKRFLHHEAHEGHEVLTRQGETPPARPPQSYGGWTKPPSRWGSPVAIADIGHVADKMRPNGRSRYGQSPTDDR